MQRIRICTSFDITQTGVTRPYKQQTLPASINNNTINTVDEWNMLRRQQSNWETILQVLLFRIQPINITKPEKQGTVSKWCFTFESEVKAAFSKNGNSLGALYEDFNGTPMILGLNEKKGLLPYISTTGTKQNIWFEEI